MEKLLNEVKSAVNFPNKKIFDYIVSRISEGGGIESCSIMRLQRDFLTIAASRGLPEKVKGAIIKVGQGIAGWVAEKGEPLLIKDVGTHSMFKDVKSRGRYKSNSLLCLPIMADGKVVGVLNLTDKKNKEHFTKEEVDFFTKIAEQIGKILK